MYLDEKNALVSQYLSCDDGDGDNDNNSKRTSSRLFCLFVKKTLFFFTTSKLRPQPRHNDDDDEKKRYFLFLHGKKEGFASMLLADFRQDALETVQATQEAAVRAVVHLDVCARAAHRSGAVLDLEGRVCEIDHTDVG